MSIRAASLMIVALGLSLASASGCSSSDDELPPLPPGGSAGTGGAKGGSASGGSSSGGSSTGGSTTSGGDQSADAGEPAAGGSGAPIGTAAGAGGA